MAIPALVFGLETEGTEENFLFKSMVIIFLWTPMIHVNLPFSFNVCLFLFSTSTQPVSVIISATCRTNFLTSRAAPKAL